MKITEEQIEELRHLLVSWEDDNISDYEFIRGVKNNGL